ncbi:unnamed protein product [Miscanthus lutarioriparius]|uniref:Uncharacterized protein n=1 Tax=Miscanthus lutarioriparius TaxID=422564 RepID=A0A811STJ3_9POAL|nr:unnamed protein product [Miscanthus lutarioriparius]
MVAVLAVLAFYIQHMLVNMAKEEVHILLGVTQEIDKMGVKLGDLKNFLTDADRRNITDLSVKAWVGELRDAMYVATNILDLCQLKAMEQGPSRDMGCFNPLLFCMRTPLHAHDIGNRIKNLNKRLDDIKARSASFNFVNLGSYEDDGSKKASFGSSTRETSGALDGSGLVVGGIGKTTLAQKIFNNDIIQQDFTKKIWLSVNQDFDEIELLRRAISEAGGYHHVAGNAKTLQERALIEALKGHRTLLIMDDVWDYRAWEGVLRTPFLNAALAHGSRVLITTRHDNVARGMMAEEPYHHINKLDPGDAWLLLKKQVVRSVNDEPQLEMLKDIGMGIIEKCDGLPLAVKVIGGLLRQKNIRPVDWENVLKDSLWSVSQMPKELSNSIYLSYDDLGPGLKHCFLHYSLLPKDTIFLVGDIVGMWISEGFLHGTSRDLEEIGKEYYDELIQRNLIEPNKRTSIKSIPEGFRGITSLRKLHGFPTHMDGDRCSLQDLGPLCQLTELGIRLMENVSSSSFATEVRLSVKACLRELALSCTSRLGADGRLEKDKEGDSEKKLQIEEVFNELCPPSSLENLHIHGYFGQRLPRWMMSTESMPLESLRILTMDDLACCTELPDGLCQLPWLELLQIDRAPAIRRLGQKFVCCKRSRVAAGFSRLLKLNFIGMVEWEEWEWEEQVHAMPVLEYLQLKRCNLSHVPRGLAFHTKKLRELHVNDVNCLKSLDHFSHVVLLEAFRNTDLERISFLPSLKNLVICNCPRMKVLMGVPALQTLLLEDYGMETLPRYLKDVNPRHLELHCTLSLLTSIAARKSSPEWDKLKHIQHVKAYADGNGRKWYVMYTRDPFHFETNISRATIGQATRTLLFVSCSKPELINACRCNCYRHVVAWLRGACLHCSEAMGVASLSEQWMEAVGYAAYIGYQTTYGRLQQQKETSSRV